MSDLKILGCKVKQSVYNEFKSLDGDVSTNLRAAIENHIKHTKEPELTAVNHVETVVQYEGLVSMLEKHETDIQQLIVDYEHVEGSDEFIILILKNISLLFHLLQPMLTSLDLLLQQESLKAKQRQGTRTDLKENIPPNLGESNGKTRDKADSWEGV